MMNTSERQQSSNELDNDNDLISFNKGNSVCFSSS